MLRIGSRDKLQIRREQFDFGCDLRLLYISDLHLTRWAQHIVQQLEMVLQDTEPDVILLGGDLVDLVNGLPLLAAFIRSCPCEVWAVSGNHDERVGLEVVRQCVEAAGGHWLEKAVAIHPRLAISGLCQPVQTDHAVLVAHDPAVFPEAVAAGYRLVLAGHLHGGQAILAHHDGRAYPGGFISRWNGDQFTLYDSTLLVSKGVHDTLPVRWNCPREVILCCC